MHNYGRSLASLQWSENTLLKGNSVLMPVLTKSRADFLYFHAKRRFKKWLVYANRNSRILEFRNGAILRIPTTEELARKNRGMARNYALSSEAAVMAELNQETQGDNDI